MGTPNGMGYIAVIAMLLGSVLPLAAGFILNHKGYKELAKSLWIVGGILSFPLLIVLVLIIFFIIL